MVHRLRTPATREPALSNHNAIEAGARQRSHTPRWSKADFVGACVLIPACTKSLLEGLPENKRETTLAYWKDGFASFLPNDDGGRNVEEDFVVKIHAAVRSSALDRNSQLTTYAASSGQFEQWPTWRRKPIDLPTR